ncbi:MAG: ATP synthase F1 subunit delta [Ignavibacteria bacterium]|nr:ATP synthase F1 subunit delta [Ignavibacteria bacterium]
MASSKRAAHRYALAVLDLATELQYVDSVADDFAMLNDAMQSSRELKNFFRSPIINRQKKKMIVNELFLKKVSKPTMNFLSLIAAKGREELLPEIVEEFIKLNNVRHNLLNITVDSAVELTSSQKEQLIHHWERITKKSVRLQAIVDRALQGGFVVRVGDTVWDASVKRQLEMMWEKFTGEH